MTEPDWKTLPSLTTLRAFDAVARHGGFSSAARGLNVTRAAVAQAVRGLERDLGKKLVERSGRGLRLTEDGLALANATNAGFDQIARGVEDLRARPLTVRLTTTNFISDAVIVPRIAEFWKRHPDIRLSILPSDEAIDLAAQGYDIAIRGGARPVPGFTLRPILESPWVAVVSPQHAGRDPVSLPWIGRPTPMEDHLIRSFGFDPQSIERLDLGNTRFEVDAAERGMGIALATEIVVRDALNEGRLARIDAPSSLTQVYSILTPEKGLRPEAEILVNWLFEIFSDIG